MSHGKSDAEIIATTHNTARYFTEKRHISWVLLAATLGWGVFGYLEMPKRKDPEVPPNIAVAMVAWPGASAERMEHLVTRKLEEKIAENSKVEKIQSLSRTNLAMVFVTLDERVKERGKEFDDIALKLDAIKDLPEGVQPIQFIKDFGDTAALMLTVASPKASEIEVSLRARAVRKAVERVRAKVSSKEPRVSVIVAHPPTAGAKDIRRARDLLLADADLRSFGRDLRPVDGVGFMGVDGIIPHDDEHIRAFIAAFVRDRMRASEIHPDTWYAAIIRNVAETEERLAAVAGDKYSYRDLEKFTDLIKRTLQTVPQVSKISRAGILGERIFLDYSQERLASYGVPLPDIRRILGARNITLPGGSLEVGGRNLAIDPSGEFKSEREIGGVILSANEAGNPVYLRDIVEVSRGYESPPRFLNFYNWRDAEGRWQRTRAITLAVQMRSGEQIGEFGRAVDAALGTLRLSLPEDLVIARTSDQPLQVKESIDLFMKSLWEAIGLVVLVSLVGFFEWRSAVLMALSIPITLAMTFGLMALFSIDLQQVSIASLIIALGLLVDDPVVAGDAIKRELASGKPPGVAAWLGPTKLATAILFATITNIVAYLPFLLLTGNTGQFIYSLPIVIGSSLLASRIVSMTFIPLIGYYLLRPSRKPARSAEDRKAHGLTGLYYRIGNFALNHRWIVLGGAVLLLGGSAFVVRGVKQEFFPKDYSQLAYVDVWLPEDAPLVATNEAATRVEAVIREVADEYGRAHPGKGGKPRQILDSLTTFVGGGGPRFWFSVSPELQQLNYAQVIFQVRDKHDTGHLVAPLQRALSGRIHGALVDVRQLETNPVGIPLSIRVSGENLRLLRSFGEKVKDVLRSIPEADRVRDDWGEESFSLRLEVDPDRANLAGISNVDVAMASATAMSGYPVTMLREGSDQIPVMARLRLAERAKLADLQSLYVYSTRGAQKVPLRQVSSLTYGMTTEKLRRRNQFRTITVSGFAIPGVLPSEVLKRAMPRLEEIRASLPSGYKLEIGGEYEEQGKGFKRMVVVLVISVLGIFLSLVIQFKNAVKPILVFAAIPFGMAGAFGFLVLMGQPFGFMAFLGAISLIGVIVSHVIVLFDFIEEAHAEGRPLRDALLEAGLVRLRPVLITVGATVFGLVPLALSGGPLWEPLCYLHIGGLTLATVVTLLIVPVLYAIFVLDLKWVKWEETTPASASPP
jgi:multidrug efflux pump subunit AcrB